MEPFTDIKEADLYLLARPWKRNSFKQSLKVYKIRLELPLLTQTRTDKIISPRKLLLAVAISYALVTLGHLVPGAPSVEDKATPLLEKNSNMSWAEGTDMVVRDDVSSDMDSLDTYPDTNLTALQVRNERRQLDFVGPDMRRRIHLAENYAFLANYGPAILGLVTAYKDFKEEGGGLNGFMCVVSAIATIWTTFLLIDKAILAGLWVGHLAQTYVEGWMAKRGLEAQHILDEYSALLGLEVRHIGFWNDTAAASSGNLKRSTVTDNNLTPVFRVSSHGFNFHFAHRGEIDGQPVMRFGFDGDHGDHGLSDDGLSDDGLDKRGRAGNYYFDKGGIDFRFNPVDPLEPGWWKDDDKHFDWLVQQISCLLKESTFWGDKVVDANGIFFQIYDNIRGTTVATAAMATFAEGGKSGIEEMVGMTMEGGIEINRNCMEVGEFDIWG